MDNQLMLITIKDKIDECEEIKKDIDRIYEEADMGLYSIELCLLYFISYFHSPEKFEKFCPKEYLLLNVIDTKKIYLLGDDLYEVGHKLCSMELYLLKTRSGFNKIKNYDMYHESDRMLKQLKVLRKHIRKYMKKPK